MTLNGSLVEGSGSAGPGARRGWVLCWSCCGRKGEGERVKSTVILERWRGHYLDTSLFYCLGSEASGCTTGRVAMQSLWTALLGTRPPQKMSFPLATRRAESRMCRSIGPGIVGQASSRKSQKPNTLHHTQSNPTRTAGHRHVHNTSKPSSECAAVVSFTASASA